MSIQRIIANNSNVLKSAAITATSVKPSQLISLAATNRQGNGQVSLVGPYTGSDDATFDIEISGTTGGSARVSTPIFSGSGSGQLINVLPGTLAGQDITVTLGDMGISTQKALLDFYGVTLQAKAAGSIGNIVTLTVTDQTVKTASTASLFNEITENQETLNGVENNFNAVPLSAKGEMDPASVRMMFGDDPQVFRQYKKFVKNEWEYHLVPPAPRRIRSGAVVSVVTGGYTLSVSDGSITETYGGVVTLYDALNAIQTNSSLIEIIGVVAKDTQPQGMATLDVMLKTAAYHLPVTRSSSSMPALQELLIPAAASTQKIVVRCTGNDIVGNEVWNINGSISGYMGDTATNRLAAINGYEFRIPQWLPEFTSQDTKNSISISNINFVSRLATETEPEICIDGILGIASKSGTLTAIYTKYTKTEECDCEKATISGVYSREALGLSAATGGVDMLDATYQAELQELYTWREAFVRSNTSKTVQTPAINAVTETTNTPTIEGWVGFSATEILPTINETINKTFVGETAAAAAVLAQAYVDQFNDRSYIAWPASWHRDFYGWDATGLQMTFDPVTIAYTVIGTITGPIASALIKIQNGSDVYRLYYPPNLLIYPDLPQAAARVSALNTAATDLSVTTIRTIDNGVTVTISPSIRAVTKVNFSAAEKDMAWMEQCFPLLTDSLAKVYTNTAALLSWTTLKTEMLADISNLSTTTRDDLSTFPLPQTAFRARYQAALDNIYLAAGFVPGKDSPSTSAGAGLWVGAATDYWSIPGYAPVYTNTIYHSTKLDADKNPYQTKEWAFVIKCSCVTKLKYGDSISIVIDGGATQSKTYNVNDTYEIPVISASPVHLAGGVDGNDTVTWNVKGMTSGALSSHDVVNNVSPHYHDLTSGVEFDLLLGGIPFALSDQFRFSIENGQFRWRKDGGVYSLSTSLSNPVLSDGLTAVFTPGASPSYVPGDFFSFAIRQPSSPVNITTPVNDRAWTFSAGAIAHITPALPITASALCIIHTMPPGSLIAFGSPLFGSASITTGASGIEYIEGDSQTLSEIVLTLSADGSIVYLWVGQPLTTDLAPDSIEVRRQWDMIRGGKSNYGAIYLAQGFSGKISWQNFISKVEFDAHIAMIDHVKKNGDEPIVFVPHHLHTEEAFLCRVEVDQVDMLDLMQYHPDNSASRIMSLAIPFAPITQ